MATITLPKKIRANDTFEVKGEEFVVLKKSFFEKLLRFSKMGKLDQGLEKALEDVKMGRLLGPFESVNEFKEAIRKR